MTDIDLLMALDDQTTRQLKQAQAGFWKVGIACVAVGAAIGGLFVQFLILACL